MSRAFVMAALLSVAATPALAQGAHAHLRQYSMVQAEVDATETDGATKTTWDAEAWYGGDDRKLWVKSEGELQAGDVERAEVQALYSANVADFWDVQAGLRHDVEPRGASYLVLGVHGLARYQFETDAAVFLSDKGDLSLRALQSIDLRLTQRLVLEPQAEIEASFSDVSGQAIAAGFNRVEASAQLRYEITRKFSPYVEIAYERLLGDTARLARTRGEDRDETTLRGGLRLWF